MTSLPVHDVANGNTPMLCALVRGHAELKADEYGCVMGLFVLRAVMSKVDLDCRPLASPDRGEVARFWRESPRFNSVSCPVTASGPMRRPAAGSLFCFAHAPCGLRFPSATDPP
jgi:hypothetical protein